MGDTRNTPPDDVTLPIGAWKRGYDVGLYTAADDPKWRDKCPYPQSITRGSSLDFRIYRRPRSSKEGVGRERDPK